MVSVILISEGKRPELHAQAYDSIVDAVNHFYNVMGVTADIILSTDPNKTTGQNFNVGLGQVSTDYVRWVGDDDLLIKESLVAQVRAMPGFDFICADAEFFGEAAGPLDGQIYHSQIPRSASILANHNCIHGGTMMYRTDVLREVGGMADDLITGEEYELNMRLLHHGYKLGYLNEVVYRNRLHFGQKSGGGVNQPRDFKDVHDRRAYLARIKSAYL